MKKNIKKFASLMLALVMAIGLAAPAFAAPTDAGTATLNVNIEGVGEDLSYDLSVGENTSIYTAINTAEEDEELAEILTPVDWKEVPDWENPEIKYQALQSMGTYATEGVNMSKTHTVNANQWISGRPGYALLDSTVNAAGKVVYHYLYAGYAWTYTVTRDGKTVEPEVYMDQYILQDGDTVTLTYSYSETTWDTTTPILPDTGALLNVVVNNEDAYTYTLNVGQNTSIYTAIQADKDDFDSILLPVMWKPVSDWKNPAIKYQALQSMGKYATEGVNSAPGYTVKEWIEGRPGYGLIDDSKKDANGKTVYEYLYAGSAWTYTVTRNDKTVEPEVYMDQYILQDGDVVTLTYSFSVTTWETTTPILPIAAD